MKDDLNNLKKVAGRPKLSFPVAGFSCPGCHYGIIYRIICEVIEDLGIEGETIGLSGVGCSFIGAPMAVDIDWTACPHGRAPAMATAIKRIHPEATVLTVQGDGDLGAIGLGCFMNALVRGENLTTVFLNNAVYGTTGGQMAPTTLLGMKTTTTPDGRGIQANGYPLHVPELAATMRGVAYAARCTVHTPANFQKAKKSLKTALQKQIDGIGYGIVEFISACPPGWGMKPLECLDFISEKMLEEYPLGEFKNVDKLDQ
jgi:2-oxoglutarate ferredoxin oxidoreductase subunit beta